MRMVWGKSGGKPSLKKGDASIDECSPAKAALPAGGTCTQIATYVLECLCFENCLTNPVVRLLGRPHVSATRLGTTTRMVEGPKGEKRPPT
jgi:hypothetical protein